MKLFTAALLFSLSAFARPNWATGQTFKKQGSDLYIISEGFGASLNIARVEALNNARKTAADFINSDFKVKTLTIRTDEANSLHEEISATKSVKNMNCTPIDDFYEESDSVYRIWLKSKCSLNALVTNASEKSDHESVLVSENQYVVVSTIPKCSSILIRGDRPRSIACKNNPQNILIYESDKQIIFRATGYLPKTIDISRNPNSNGPKAIEVRFEKN